MARLRPRRLGRGPPGRSRRQRAGRRTEGPAGSRTARRARGTGARPDHCRDLRRLRRLGRSRQRRRRDGSVAVQLPQPQVSARSARTTRLAAGEGLGGDPPLTAPRPPACRGLGGGGDWQVTIPQDQFDSGLDLSGLTEIQVWIGHQFVR